LGRVGPGVLGRRKAVINDAMERHVSFSLRRKCNVNL
jgi:hypothetical protein